MKKCYFTLLLLVTISAYGQKIIDTTDNTRQVVKEKPSFKLYPNPAFNDMVYITTPHNSNRDIAVYDVFGEVVLRDRITSNTLNISKLIAGVYVLQVTENNETMTRKLVVK